ncbi:MAG: N-6 DNA methylase, partial [Euryarchaeota archaeon]|nr:N-6 DNA methylase [Euryarchaeota archaeon]
MAQTTLNYLNNRNLFSTHYLESLVKENPEWKEDVTDAFNRAKKLFNSRKESWSRMDESMLEMFLIRPILKDALGHHFVPQAKVELGARRPDYAFFENDGILSEALEKKGFDDFYLKAVAVGDAKSWKTSLDKKVKGAKGSFEFQNPSFQIDHYLHVTPVQWGILTNGRFWRIYHKDTSYKLDSYYEIDLATILETNDIEGFKYFYLFFRLNAFVKDASGRSFLERVKDESIAYAKKLGVNLQKNVYDAMRVLSEGFFEWKDNALAKDEIGLRDVQENTLKLLYRLLFIFYAESLKLLDRDNPEYKKLSLESIKYDVANKIDSRELILRATTDYWNKLDTLFALINEGSESEKFRIPKNILSIPAYNGGLFDPKRNPFLQNKRIGDEFIAKAINLLAREGKDFIDYSTLGTRQLGSIYEGLLEYKLKVAEEDLVAIKEKGHERWLPKKEAEGKKTFDEIRVGAIYLATDKGERKATGSYYTPDYIVKYIVRNTLTPILDERRIAWKEKGLGERPFLHDILSIKVLDPAMGSGHFLVEACEFLANKLVEAWGEARPEELESVEVAEHDVHWARREVVRHCIFGVDLNPMAVELAKLSLWLETVAANKPLTFLDHHLKVGNSLIGAKVEDLKSLPSREKKEAAENGKKQLKAPTLWDFTVKKHFDELLAKYGEFAAHPDDDLKSVKLKEQEYDTLQKSEINRRLHELANVWVSTYFGAAPPPDEYAQMQNEMNPKDFPDWGRWRGRDWFGRAQEIAGEKRFFHWELEFPESFYEKGAPKENPGWDAVVGNPPWGAAFDKQDKSYLSEVFESYFGDIDSCNLFTEIGIKLVSNKGNVGFITPNTWLYTAQNANARKYVLKNSHPHEIV